MTRRHPKYAKPWKIYSSCTISEVIIKNVFQQNTKANPIKEETRDPTNRESSQAAHYKESPQGQMWSRPTGSRHGPTQQLVWAMFQRCDQRGPFPSNNQNKKQQAKPLKKEKKKTTYMKIVVQMQLNQTWCDSEHLREENPCDLNDPRIPLKRLKVSHRGFPTNRPYTAQFSGKYSLCNCITRAFIYSRRTECKILTSRT